MSKSLADNCTLKLFVDLCGPREMASWLQNQLKAAEGLLEAVDRTAKKSIKSQAQQRGQAGSTGREPEHEGSQRERLFV